MFARGAISVACGWCRVFGKQGRHTGRTALARTRLYIEKVSTHWAERMLWATILLAAVINCPTRWTREFCNAYGTFYSTRGPSAHRVLVDVGAAFGHEISVARSYGDAAIGIECRSDEFQRLDQRFAADRNVLMVHACAGNTSGLARLWRAQDSSSLIKEDLKKVMYKAKRESKPVEYVPRVLVDDIVATLNIGVGFIKCDVQGYEEQVLAGAARTIRHFHPHLLYEASPSWGSDGVGLLRSAVGPHLASRYNCSRVEDQVFCRWNGGPGRTPRGLGTWASAISPDS